MRKITKLASEAFWDKKYFKMTNTVVLGSFGEITLHKTIIAKIDFEKNTIRLNNGGYQTNTTKERLNGILEKIGYKISQKNDTWYITDRFGNKELFLNGMEIQL